MRIKNIIMREGYRTTMRKRFLYGTDPLHGIGLGKAPLLSLRTTRLNFTYRLPFDPSRLRTRCFNGTNPPRMRVRRNKLFLSGVVIYLRLIPQKASINDPRYISTGTFKESAKRYSRLAIAIKKAMAAQPGTRH